jgi:uncharacterized protein
LSLAETQAHFKVDEASPMAVAPFITVPVLVIHGEDDEETSPDHAHRIFTALSGPKRLILAPGAGHSQALNGQVWGEIDRWIGAALSLAEHDPVVRPRED